MLQDPDSAVGLPSAGSAGCSPQRLAPPGACLLAAASPRWGGGERNWGAAPDPADGSSETRARRVGLHPRYGRGKASLSVTAAGPGSYGFYTSALL